MNRRDFVAAALAGGAVVGSSIALPHAVQGQAAQFRALICLQQLGGCDNFLFAIPTDTQRRNALVSRRGAVHTAYYSDPNLFHLGFGRNIALHPELRFLQPYLNQMRVTLGVANAMHVPNSGSHEIQQIRMSLGTEIAALATAGWKARLYDRSSIRMLGFTGLRSQDVACASARCQEQPPLVVDQFSTYRLTGAALHWQIQGGSANTNHVTTLIREMAAIEEASSEPKLEEFRRAQRSMLVATDDVTYTTSTFITPRFSEYASLYSPSIDYHGYLLAIRFRDVAQYLMRMRNEGTSDRIVVTIPHGGYDTHSRFFASGAWLMGHLGRVLRVFLDDLSAMGILNNVVVHTETEFGRQIAANGANAADGTDHGVAFNTLTVGGRVRGGANALWGEMMSPTALLNEYGWPRAVDSRALIAELIEQHLGLNPMTTAFAGPIASEFTRTSFSLLNA